MKKNQPIDSHSGFTLIELAVVIVIVGIIISIVASVLPSLIASSKVKQAKTLLERADNALQGYSIANNRLPFADNTNDGVEDSGVFSGNLPYITLGLSFNEDVWGEPIQYAVYGGGTTVLFDLTQNFADEDAFCTEINNASTAAFDATIVHTTTASPCSGADATNSTNQAYVLASGGLKDLDGINGHFDDCNDAGNTDFNIPGKIQTTAYDDLVRAYSINELNQKNCSGSGGGGGGGSGEAGYTNGCSNDIDDDSDSDIDCLDSDCASDTACNLNITTTSIPSGPVNSAYLTTFAASGGRTPYQWSLVDNGGFSDFSITAGSGTLSGTLDQCPGTYTIEVSVQDATPAASGGPLTDSQTFDLTVTSDLTVSRTSGPGTDITWSSPTQEETFIANGGRLGIVNWTLNTGGATGFDVFSTGDNTCAIRKTGSTTPNTYTFTLTATDANCATNTDDLVLNVTVTAGGAGSPGVISGVVDTLIFDSISSYNPDIIHISGDIYVVAYTGQSNDGFIRTVQIASDGQITDTTIDSLEFDTQEATNPDLVHVTGDIYAIAYTDRNDDGQVITVEIDSAGQITNSTIDALEFNTTNCFEPDIIQIDTDTYAIAYAGPWWQGGLINTVQITATGQISNSVTDTLVFDTTWWGGYYADLVHINGDVYAVAYSGPSWDGFVTTVTIDSAGQIGNATIDSLEFHTSNIEDPDITQVSGDIYAISYMGSGNDGFITTVEIASDGSITTPTIDTLEFDTVNGMEPVILSAGSGIFTVTYSGSGEDGFIITVQIDDTGQINNSVLDSLEFDTNTGREPSIVSITSSIYAVAYRGQGQDGIIKTIALQ